MMNGSVLLCLLLAACVPNYCHGGFYGGTTTTTTVPVTGPATPVTVTNTQTFRVTVTSNVWNTHYAESTVEVPQVNTVRNYVPAQPSTSTSVLQVTSTQINLVRETKCVNPEHTVVSYRTSYVTVTETRRIYTPVTHVEVFQQVETVALPVTRTVVQRVVSNTMVITTHTITSVTGGGYNYYTN